MRLICNRTQNDAIWELIALFLTNQIAGNTIDFKMNVIIIETYISVTVAAKETFPKNLRNSATFSQVEQFL